MAEAELTASLAGPFKPTLAKNAAPTLVTSLGVRRAGAAAVLATLVADIDATPLVRVLPVTLPAAYEDLDIAFTHTYWTPEINTTRRNDHNARFRVT